MVDCDYFEVIDWEEDTNKIIHAVCSMPSPCWPNCGSCTDRVPYKYKENAALLQEADMLGLYKPPVLLRSKAAALWQSDVDVLDGSQDIAVRINPYEDAEVKRLYHIWKSL